jgi:hypothetical protein
MLEEGAVIDPAYLARIGVFVDTDGSYKRHRLRTRRPEWDPEDPKAETKGLLVAYEEEEVPFPVVLPIGTDPDSIEQARVKAATQNADFHHPRFGWLRWGRKPERDHDENLGSGTVRYPTRRVVVGDDPAPAEDPDSAGKGA